MPTILLARAGKYDAGRHARRGREGRRVGGLEEGGPDHEPAGGHPADRRRRPARPRRRGLPDRRQVARRAAVERGRSATSSPTASRPTPARRSIARSWSATRTPSSRASRFAAYAVGATRAFIAVRANLATALRRLQRAVRTAEERATSAPTRSAPASTSTSRSLPIPAAWSSARRRRCCARSRTSAPSPTSGRRIPRARAVGPADRRQQRRDARRSCRGSWPTAPRHLPPSATPRRPGHHARPVQRRGEQAGHRRGAAGHVAAQAARHRVAASAKPRPCSWVARPAASCRRLSSTRSTRPRR